MDSVFKEIDRLQPKYLQFLKDIVSIESKSEDIDGVMQVGKFVEEFAKKEGYDVKENKFENAPSTFTVTYNKDSKEKMVTMSAHMDTVHKKGAIKINPIRIEGDRIYGPGMADCKGGIAVFMLAVEALKNTGFNKRPLRIILQSDEEVTGKTTNSKGTDKLCEDAKNSIAFLNGEMCEKDKVLLERKGIVKFLIKIRGRAAHSGVYKDGISAVREGAYKIIELEKISDINDVTFNIGIASGGTAHNIIPEYCELKGEYRFKTNEGMERCQKHLTEVVEKSYVEGTKSEFEIISKRPAMELKEKNIELFNKINEVSKKYGLGEVYRSGDGAGSDAAFVSQADIPVVDGMGIEGYKYHTKDEYAVLSSLALMAKRAAALIKEI